MCSSGAITSPTLTFINMTKLRQRLIKRTITQEKVLIMLIKFIFASISLCQIMIQEIELTKALRFIQEFDDVLYIFILSSVLLCM